MTSSTAAGAEAGITTKHSPLTVAATVTRLTELIGAKRMKVFAVIDRWPRSTCRSRSWSGPTKTR